VARGVLFRAESDRRPPVPKKTVSKGSRLMGASHGPKPAIQNHKERVFILHPPGRDGMGRSAVQLGREA